MLEIKIRRPKFEDMDQLTHFFSTVITHTFNKNGIGDKITEMKDEIAGKHEYLRSDLESNGEVRFFLIAIIENEIIGSIHYGPANELICESTDNTYKNLKEIGTVFVHPDFQSQGVGNLLLKSIYVALKNKGITEFCLDSGYKTAQQIWTHKFGEPNYFLKDYWDEGSHHMIWKRKVGSYS